MSERSGAELKAVMDVLDCRCQTCECRVLPGAVQCIDCKYGPLPDEGDE